MEQGLTTSKALEYLQMSRATFFHRVKEFDIKPINYNPALRRQTRPLWSMEDLNRLREISPSEKD